MTDDEIVMLLTMQFGAPRRGRNSNSGSAEGVQYNQVTSFLLALDGVFTEIPRLRQLYYAQAGINSGSPIDAPERRGY